MRPSGGMERFSGRGYRVFCGACVVYEGAVATQSGVPLSRLPQASLGRPGCDLATRSEAQFGEGAADVGGDRPLAEEEFRSDLAVRLAMRDERRHFAFTPG